MRCDDETRGDGVAPIPVAEAGQQAHKSGPKARRPHQLDGAAVHLQSKNAREFEGGALIGPRSRPPQPLSRFWLVRSVLVGFCSRRV